jgi:hypothetical protein
MCWDIFVVRVYFCFASAFVWLSSEEEHQRVCIMKSDGHSACCTIFV